VIASTSARKLESYLGSLVGVSKYLPTYLPQANLADAPFQLPASRVRCHVQTPRVGLWQLCLLNILLFCLLVSIPVIIRQGSRNTEARRAKRRPVAAPPAQVSRKVVSAPHPPARAPASPGRPTEIQIEITRRLRRREGDGSKRGCVNDVPLVMSLVAFPKKPLRHHRNVLDRLSSSSSSDAVISCPPPPGTRPLS